MLNDRVRSDMALEEHRLPTLLQTTTTSADTDEVLAIRTRTYLSLRALQTVFAAPMFLKTQNIIN